jgi:hypothetical protein
MAAVANGHAAGLAFAGTLFDLEERLEALSNSAETVTPDQEQAFLAEFQAALAGAADKRDRVAGMLARLENQQAFASAEIKRLQEFKAGKARDQERLEGYVAYCIDSLGRDAKGKRKKLEGNMTVMFLKACPVSLEVVDEAAVPAEFKRATVTLPAAVWNDVFLALDEDFRETVIAAAGDFAIAVDKRAAKAAMEAGADVPGAKLVTDKTSLGRK